MLLGALLCVCGVEERSDERKKVDFCCFRVASNENNCQKAAGMAEKKAVVF